MGPERGTRAPDLAEAVQFRSYSVMLCSEYQNSSFWQQKLFWDPNADSDRTVEIQHVAFCGAGLMGIWLLTLLWRNLGPPWWTESSWMGLLGFAISIICLPSKISAEWAAVFGDTPPCPVWVQLWPPLGHASTTLWVPSWWHSFVQPCGIQAKHPDAFVVSTPRYYLLDLSSLWLPRIHKHVSKLPHAWNLNT